jgi:hypothetical protein
MRTAPPAIIAERAGAVSKPQEAAGLGLAAAKIMAFIFEYRKMNQWVA